MSDHQNNYVISIDAGTQSVRAAIIDMKGHLVHIERVAIDAYFAEKPGYAEQDADYLWGKLCESTQALMANSTIDVQNIKGLSITTQRGTVVNVDKNGKTLRPAIIWLDQRKAKMEKWPNPILKKVFQAVNIYGSLSHAVKDGECNWIRQNQKEIWAKTHKYLYLSGFFNYRLTDEFIDSVGNMVGYMPFDYKKQQWAKPNSINTKLFPVEPEKLAQLVPPSEIIGKITAKAAQETGLPQGLTLVAAAADKACEVLGSGCYTPDIACLSYGTTATIETVNPKYKEVIRFFPSYPSAIPNHFNTEVMIYRGFWMIKWFKEQFGHKEMELAKKTGKNVEALFDEMIAHIPPGSMGLTLQPYWSPGVRIPGVEAKGAVIGFGDVHTRAHLYRSILEGLTYALKEGADLTQKRTGVKIKKLRVSGGGSQSNHALQMTADIFNLPVEKPSTYETSALGAAINCAVGLKLHDSFEIAIEHMCSVRETFYPDPENTKLYEKLFNQIYKKMYGRLKPLYKDIRRITNYPNK